MRNKIHELFDAGHEQFVKNALDRITKRWYEEKSCFVCKYCKDISDERNTCHLCAYTNNLLPEGLTCLLWESNND